MNDESNHCLKWLRTTRCFISTDVNRGFFVELVIHSIVARRAMRAQIHNLHRRSFVPVYVCTSNSLLQQEHLMSCDYSTVPLVRCILLVRTVQHSTYAVLDCTRTVRMRHVQYVCMMSCIQYRVRYAGRCCACGPVSGCRVTSSHMAWWCRHRYVCQSSCAVVRDFAICLC